MTAIAETLLYRLYDDIGALLYVGVTDDWDRRRSQHATERPWFGEVSRVVLETCPDRTSALAREVAAISNEAPRYNVNHKPRPPALPLPEDVTELVETSVTLAQAAKELGMDRSAAYRAFPPEIRRKIGTVWFITRADVDAYAAEQRRGWPIGRPRPEKRGGEKPPTP